MKTYTAFIASDWPRFYTIFQRWVRIHYKTTGTLFKTKKRKKRVRHKQKLVNHMQWLIEHKFNTTRWSSRYINRNFMKEDIIVLIEND